MENTKFTYNLIAMRPMMGAKTVKEAIEAFSTIIGIPLVPKSEKEQIEKQYKSEKEKLEKQYELAKHDFEIMRKAEEKISSKYRTLCEIVKPIKDIEL